MRYFLFGLLFLLSGCFLKSANGAHGYYKKSSVEIHKENQATLRRGYGLYRPQYQYPHMDRKFKRRSH